MHVRHLVLQPFWNTSLKVYTYAFIFHLLNIIFFEEIIVLQLQNHNKKLGAFRQQQHLRFIDISEIWLTKFIGYFVVKHDCTINQT